MIRYAVSLFIVIVVSTIIAVLAAYALTVLVSRDTLPADTYCHYYWTGGTFLGAQVYSHSCVTVTPPPGGKQ